ncbi:hypothetical protein GGR57DRAFT_423326 [Xylariaceae sp. FL1272]|nr:hypothetical protein GGR57DRAFT_423326 [Xylariaceae sp. FL1272]
MDMPTEIWQLVLGVIHDKATIARFGRTCKFFRELAIPLLYQKFETFTLTDDGVSLQYQSLSAFIRTITKHPHLAKVVTEMNCTTSAFTKHYDREDLFNCYSQYDSALVGDVARRLGVPPANIRMSSGALWTVSSTSSFMHQLLVCLLPNLRSLKLRVPSSSSGFSDCLLIWAKAPSNRLWTLSELKIEDESLSRRFNFSNVQDLIRYAPNLEYLSLKRCFSSTADCTLDLRNLKRLRIIESRFQREGLLLWRNCVRLEHFTYISFGPHVAIDRLPAEIVAALEPARETLERLEIFHFARTGQREFHQGIETLRDFPVLRIVALNPSALFPHSDLLDPVHASAVDLRILADKLPTSLVALTLVNVSPHMFQAVKHFAECAIRKEFPVLRTVSISGGPQKPNLSVDWAAPVTIDEVEWEELRYLFWRADVDLRSQTDWWPHLRTLCDMPI